jgi:hypothetical protein
MAQFELTQALVVTMTSLSLPARKKGQDIIHTTDIAFEFEGSNELLDLFDPALLPMIYREPLNPEELKSRELEGVEPISKVPMLRSASIKQPMLLALEYAGYTMIVDRGLGETRPGSNIQVDEVAVRRIRVWCKEGGSIKGSMHLQSKNVSDVQVGQLRSFLKLQTKLKLTAPKTRQGEMTATDKALDAELAGKPGVPDAAAKEHFSGHLASGTPLAAAKGASGAKPKPLTKAQQQAAARQAATDAFVDGAKPAAGTKPKAH